MGVSVYKTFISGGKQSLKAHTLASNMDRFIGKHGVTITFSHHSSRQTFISHSSAGHWFQLCGQYSFLGWEGRVELMVIWIDGKGKWRMRAFNCYLYHSLPFRHAVFPIDFSTSLPITPALTLPLGCYHREYKGGQHIKLCGSIWQVPIFPI